MARKILNTGIIANDGTGDKLRNAFDATQQNIAEVYNFLGDGNNLTALLARQRLSILSENETKQLITPKADQTYVDDALTNFTNGASKFYATLALANADIANITMKDKVDVGEAEIGGTYYKATANATSLTKSAYDAVEQSKKYVHDAKIKYDQLTGELSNFPLTRGYIASNGVDASTSTNTDTHKRTDYIVVNAGHTIELRSNEYLYNHAFYNENKKFISSPDSWLTSSSKFTASQNGFVRFAFKRVDGGLINQTVCDFAVVQFDDVTFVKQNKHIANQLISLNHLSEDISDRLINRNIELNEFEKFVGNIDSTTGANGTATSTNVHRTDFIKVEAGDIFSITNSAYVYCPFLYDENKNFISSTGTWTSASITVTQAGYVKFTTKQANNGAEINDLPNINWIKLTRTEGAFVKSSVDVGDKIIKPNHLSAETLELIGQGGEGVVTQWFGKKWLSLGDSITARGWYQPHVVSELGLDSFVNFGVGGTCLARKTTSDTTAMSVRYVDMDATADLITVWGGVNDFGYSYGSNGGTILGAIGDTSIDTVYGALATIIEGLITKYPLAKIAFIITPPVSNAMGMRSANKKGFRLEQYCQAVRDVCEYYSIPYLDLYKQSGINEKNVNIMTSNIASTAPDGLHPSAVAMERIAKKMSAFLRDL
ncbi:MULTISPECIES: SGNH/GDSL hydrolase family protein [unclassified Acinetobacter]|uniref:SGNH/GDSL hydrolase family protein n=1 Tax=unclassified Acinetobacter TaxID=196816 RepID=UPI002934B3FA|nr:MULTISPECIES: GDSL-type esterase/lipase family protein [unclassified Acinetobacter]WOE33098.1 GDSL-type esterase/lipase family protein [Acinetobacter sp. SAAs470]WOE39925.1 GDSL-type esterase/lipase family protein [Acinetobacter sp. SAAs474]